MNADFSFEKVPDLPSDHVRSSTGGVADEVDRLETMISSDHVVSPLPSLPEARNVEVSERPNPPTEQVSRIIPEGIIETAHGFTRRIEAANGDLEVVEGRVLRADLATLALAGLLVTEDEPDDNLYKGSPGPELREPVSLEVIKRDLDPEAVRQVVVRAAEAGPQIGGNWQMMADLTPIGSLRPAPETSKEFYDRLKLTPDEVARYWTLKGGANLARQQAVQDMGVVTRIQHNVVDGLVYSRGAMLEYRRKINEQTDIRKVQITADVHLNARAGEGRGLSVEQGLANVRCYLADQKQLLNSLNSQAYPGESFRGTLEPVPLSAFDERVLEYIRFAYGRRASLVGFKEADRGLERDLRFWVEASQQVEDQRVYASGDHTELMSGKRPPVSDELRRRKALLSIIKLQNELRYGPEKGAKTEDLPTALVKAFEEVLGPDEETTRAYFDDPAAVHAGRFPSMTEEEFGRGVEAAAATYKLLASHNLPEAEGLLAKFCSEIVTRLRSEAIAEGRLPPEEIDALRGRDTSYYSLEDLQNALRHVGAEVEGQITSKGYVESNTLDRQRFLTAAIAARQLDTDNREEIGHQARRQQLAEEFLATKYPGDVFIYGGAVNRVEGSPGALALALAALGTPSITLQGNTPFHNVPQLGRTTITITQSTPPRSSTYRGVLLEGRTSSVIKPSAFLGYIKPNGLGAVEVGPNLGLVAQLMLLIDPEGYKNSMIPELVRDNLPPIEQNRIAQLESVYADIGPQFRDFKWALVPSTTLRLIPDIRGLEVQQGVEQPSGKPRFTLAVFKDNSNGENDLYSKLTKLIP